MRHPSDQHRKMKNRNFALLGVLVAFVLIFAVVTFVKMGGSF